MRRIGYSGVSDGFLSQALSLSLITQIGRLPGHSVQVSDDCWREQNVEPSENSSPAHKQ